MAVALAALVVAAASGARAAVGGSSSTIKVCVRKTGGELYEAHKCAKHDKQLTWNVTGPAGPAGPSTGPAGGALSGSYPDPSLAQGVITDTNVKSGSLTGASINSSTLGEVPLAKKAEDASALGGMTVAELDASQHPVLTPGVASTLPADTCAFVISFGVGGDSEAGKLVAMWLTNAAGEAIPSLNNQSAFIPGTVALTSQGGTIAYSQVCNLSSAPDALPAGWQVHTRMV